MQSGFNIEPAFVGRNRELEELLQSLAVTLEGRGKFLIVSGEAGIGKTTLINHFLDSLSEKLSVIVLRGHCLKNSVSPYSPFMEVFCSIDTKNILEKLTGIKTTISNLSAQAAKDEVLSSLLAELTAVCAKNSVILFIDDLQWADSGSLNLLSCLSEFVPTKNLLVIATLDSKCIYDDQQQKLLETLNSINKNPSFREIKVAGLSSTEVSSLVSKTIGQHSQPLIETILNNSRGNALYTVALLKLLIDKQTTEKEKIDVAKTVNEYNDLKKIVLLIANKLVPEQRATLNIASAISQEFDPALLAKTLSKSTIEALETLNVIAQNSSLILYDGTKYRFNHALTQEILYEEIPATEKQGYHGKIAEALEKEQCPHPWQLTYHYSKANNQEKALKYSLTSGEQAISLLLNSEAIQYFKYALDIAQNNSQFLIQKEKATEGLGDALLISGDLRAAQLFEQLSDQTSLNQVKVRATYKAAHAYLLEGNHNRAFSLIQKPLNLSGIGQLENARYSLVKGTIEAWGGNIKESLLDLEGALKTFEENTSNQEIIDALIELAIAYMGKVKDNSNVQLEKSLACITRALNLSEQLKDKYLQASALQIAFAVFYAYGLKKEAQVLAEKLSKISLSINDPQSRRLNEAWSHWMTGFIIETNAMDKIFAKIFDKIEFSPQPKIEVPNDSRQEFKSAIEHGRKGEKAVDEKLLFEIRGLLYGNLCREYCFLGEMQTSDEFLNRLEAINYTVTPRFLFTRSLYLFSKALSTSFKRQWQEANKFYKESTDYFSNLQPGTNLEATMRQWYGCSLLQQGRFDDGMQQFAQSQSILNELKTKLTHPHLLGTQSAPSKVNTDTDFTIRITITNVGKNEALLQQAKNIAPANFKIISTAPILNIKDSTAEIDNKQLSAYKEETLNFTIKTTIPGTYTLTPEITYLDEVGKTKICSVDPVTITVQTPTTQSPQPLQPNPIAPPQPIAQPPTQQMPQPPQIRTISTPTPTVGQSFKPFDVFLCYKKSSAKDFADHLKAGLEELGLHTFLDSKDIPLSVVDKEVGWSRIRDNALNESKFFILIMTPGFDLSSEVVKEIDMARKQTNKTFIFFRHRNMGRRIVVKFANDSLDIGRLEQVSFESKEELLRHAVNILPCSKPS
jgi:predicted ATPase